MSERKRDQRQYDLIQQYLPGLILNTILKIVNDLGDPYTARPGLGGMTAYPLMAMAAVCIMLEAERTICRKIVSILRNNHAVAAKMHGDCTRCRRPENRQGRYRSASHVTTSNSWPGCM